MGIWFSSVWFRLSLSWGRRARRPAQWCCLIVTLVGFSELGAAMRSGGAGAPFKGGKWDLAVALPEARQESGAVALGNLIYLIDGYGADTVPSTLVQVYDTVAKQWKQASLASEALYHLKITAVDGKIYVVGGFAESLGERTPVDSVWQYDPAAHRWERREPLPTPRGAP